jgi:murein DD-endopeptidase MepM/ murein hydrolase activator NlpD
MQFPLPFVPTTSYKGGNGFGGNRDKVRKGLVHAANDLAAPWGTPVLAMEDGVVVREPYSFYSGTWALEIKHPLFIARYGEIARQTEVHAGDAVLKGQVIAYVGDQPGSDMLHLEFFTGKLTGDLSYSPGTHPPYDRRDDVFDGAALLDQAILTVTYSEGDTKYKYVTDSKGRKFLVDGPLAGQYKEFAQYPREHGGPETRGEDFPDE